MASSSSSQVQAPSPVPAQIKPESRQLTFKHVPNVSDQSKYSLSLTDTLYSLFDKAIQLEYSSIPEGAVVITGSRVADYQCNSAMAISQVKSNSTRTQLIT